ncbi:hypothetical protein CANARDRAFT_28419 [[Candida] arabinofermentans NRRL YB-2248]|uniref:Uncharacterized protein n=1 Tax=[Candida] arabinofermentans NRRL YB-2248 TaxID=983967 RepID=A0A1E4T054_9ASCO|nr:hypothetical protein CANARDRAFT_28419 [[Candida] arabinofermentans NRRL YB-2248]
MPPKRNKTHISESKAFSPLYTDQKFNIPQQLDDKLLDSFTLFGEDNNTEDLLLKDLGQFLRTYLKIPDKLLFFVNLEDFLMDGTDDIVDFEKYLYKGTLLLTLTENLPIIDMYWDLLIDNLQSESPHNVLKKGKYDGTADAEKYKIKLYIDDLSKLMKNLNDETPTSFLMEMLIVSNNGMKVYTDYFDFALILGRIGELKEFT